MQNCKYPPQHNAPARRSQNDHTASCQSTYEVHNFFTTPPSTQPATSKPTGQPPQKVRRAACAGALANFRIRHSHHLPDCEAAWHLSSPRHMWQVHGVESRCSQSANQQFGDYHYAHCLLQWFCSGLHHAERILRAGREMDMSPLLQGHQRRPLTQKVGPARIPSPLHTCKPGYKYHPRGKDIKP